MGSVRGRTRNEAWPTAVGDHKRGIQRLRRSLVLRSPMAAVRSQAWLPPPWAGPTAPLRPDWSA